MPPETSAYAREWMEIAEKDLGRSQRMMDFGDPEAAGFFLHQAIEKILKAYLLLKGWQLAKTHDLPALLSEAVAHDAVLSSYRALVERVATCYLVGRYPGVLEAPLTEEEVRQSHQGVEGLIQRVRGQFE